MATLTVCNLTDEVHRTLRGASDPAQAGRTETGEDGSVGKVA